MDNDAFQECVKLWRHGYYDEVLVHLDERYKDLIMHYVVCQSYTPINPLWFNRGAVHYVKNILPESNELEFILHSIVRSTHSLDRLSTNIQSMLRNSPLTPKDFLASKNFKNAMTLYNRDEIRAYLFPKSMHVVDKLIDAFILSFQKL